jgi:cytochrome c
LRASSSSAGEAFRKPSKSKSKSHSIRSLEKRIQGYTSFSNKPSKRSSFRTAKTITMYQFPLKLAYGINAHKAQGQTLPKVAIDIEHPAFAHGAFYVTLSRVM